MVQAIGQSEDRTAVANERAPCDRLANERLETMRRCSVTLGAAKIDKLKRTEVNRFL